MVSISNGDDGQSEQQINMTVWRKAPLADLFMPDLEPIGRWGGLVHQLLIKHAPATFLGLCQRKRLRSFIDQEQRRFAELEENTARAWRDENRPPSPALFDEIRFWRDSWAFAAEEVSASIEGDWAQWLKRR